MKSSHKWIHDQRRTHPGTPKLFKHFKQLSGDYIYIHYMYVFKTSIFSLQQIKTASCIKRNMQSVRPWTLVFVRRSGGGGGSAVPLEYSNFLNLHSLNFTCSKITENMPPAKLTYTSDHLEKVSLSAHWYCLFIHPFNKLACCVLRILVS